MEPNHDGVRKRAYIFDGDGNWYNKEWDLTQGTSNNEFCWYHVQLPDELADGNNKLAEIAQCLIQVLSPPLKFQDILSLTNNRAFCGHLDGAIVFRLNSSGSVFTKFAFKFAARISQTSLITVVNGNVLDFLNHSEEAVPRSVSKLLVRVIEMYLYHLQDFATELETELNTAKLGLDRGGFALKEKALDDAKFGKMHLYLLRLLQVIVHGERVFPQVKEMCLSKDWFGNEDINALDVLIGRTKRLKEKVGFIADRVEKIQADLRSWQAEQINRKRRYLSFHVIILLCLSIITGVFWMCRVPWTEQRHPDLKDGFRRIIIMLYFLFLALYIGRTAWPRGQVSGKSWSIESIADQKEE